MDPRYTSCYRQWLEVQNSDLDELLKALNTASTDVDFRHLIDKCMQHYHEYYQKRCTFIAGDSFNFLCPRWCSTFESSFLWIGGCRPSTFVRLLCGLEARLEAEESITENGTSPTGLSAQQLRLVNELQARTIKAEDELTSRLVRLQSGVKARTLLPLVRERMSRRVRGEAALDGAGGASADASVATVMDSYGVGLAKLVREADELRVATAREMVVEILRPRQAVEMLATTKQLHLAVGDWGQQRDREHGRMHGC